MDEANLNYSERINRVGDFVGNKRVLVKTLGGGNEKRRLTLVLAATDKGELFPPVVILGGKLMVPEKAKKQPKRKNKNGQIKDLKQYEEELNKWNEDEK